MSASKGSRAVKKKKKKWLEVIYTFLLQWQMERGMKWENESCHYLDKYLFLEEELAKMKVQRQGCVVCLHKNGTRVKGMEKRGISMSLEK